MYVEKNKIAFNLLDDNENDSESIYEYKILLFLDKPQSINQLKILHQKADLIVFSNGCWKEIFDEYGDQILPSCIIGDISSFSKEYEEIIEKNHIQLISNTGEEKTDLEKSLYYCFEKIAKLVYSPILKSKNYSYDPLKSAIIVYFDPDNRFDNIMSIYSEVSKYNESKEIDIIMLSYDNMSMFLKEGINMITPSVCFQPKNIGGFSITSFNQAKCKIYEVKDEDGNENTFFLAEKIVRFGDNFYSSKSFYPKKIKIDMMPITSLSTAIYFTSIKLPE